MFTLKQIADAHDRVKSGADFPQYIQDIRLMGVTAFTTYVSDSHTKYDGERDYHLASEPQYAPLTIATKGNAQALKQSLKIHQSGSTDYFTFCRQAAAAGVENWRVDMATMTCTYHDAAGNVMVAEHIPQVAQQR